MSLTKPFCTLQLFHLTEVQPSPTGPTAMQGILPLLFLREFLWFLFSPHLWSSCLYITSTHVRFGRKKNIYFFYISTNEQLWALRTLFVCIEFTKKVFEQLTLAVAFFTSHHPASGEISISSCDVTWRTVKVDHYCLPATTIHARSLMTFPAFNFSIVS